MINIIDFALHIDKYLQVIIQNFGSLTYVLMFLVIFCETGLVITPFLPGDSLLFVLGTLSANGLLNILLVYVLMLIAAILGDSVNYFIGKYLEEKVSNSGFVKKKYLDKAKIFYEKYGGKTIILARFVPIIRTFAPFIAGIGEMNYKKFFIFNVIGAFLWITLFLFAGYFFGNLGFVKNNLTLIIYIIIIISIIPAIIEVIREKMKNKGL
jgi:membrane-associated protein